jgi:hypothetical protein
MKYETAELSAKIYLPIPITVNIGRQQQRLYTKTYQRSCDHFERNNTRNIYWSKNVRKKRCRKNQTSYSLHAEKV